MSEAVKTVHVYRDWMDGIANRQSIIFHTDPELRGHIAGGGASESVLYTLKEIVEKGYKIKIYQIRSPNRYPLHNNDIEMLRREFPKENFTR